MCLQSPSFWLICAATLGLGKKECRNVRGSECSGHPQQCKTQNLNIEDRKRKEEIMNHFAMASIGTNFAVSDIGQSDMTSALSPRHWARRNSWPCKKHRTFEHCSHTKHCHWKPKSPRIRFKLVRNMFRRKVFSEIFRDMYFLCRFHSCICEPVPR